MAQGPIISRAYGFNGYVNVFPEPIVTTFAPTSGAAGDTAINGQLWVDTTNQDAYIMVDSTTTQWINVGGGAGLFANLTVNPGPTALTGQLTVTSGTNAVNIAADAAANTVNIATGAGAKALTVGSTNTTSATTIQAGTGAMTFTAGGIFDVNATGAVTVDTAAGISLDAATASNFTVTGAGIDLTLSSVGGSVVVSSDEDIANAISLLATAGGIDIQATGAAAQDIQIINTGGSVTMTASEAAANAIRIAATDVAGGMDIDAGTAGVIVDTTGAISLDAAAASNFTATGAFDVTVSSTAGSVNITGGEAATDAVLISASSATGGITLDAGVLPGVRITNGTQTAQIMVGTGDPNGTAGLRGSIFLNVAGVADTILWVNVDDGTTWTALTST